MTIQVEPTGQPLSTRAKVLISLAGGLVLVSMLVTAVFSFLLAPPRRAEVVTLKAGVGQEAREKLKVDCGRLAGVMVVEDKGDPEKQGRFPVRFETASATAQQVAALHKCLNDHDDIVQGFLTEGDR